MSYLERQEVAGPARLTEEAQGWLSGACPNTCQHVAQQQHMEHAAYVLLMWSLLRSNGPGPLDESDLPGSSSVDGVDDRILIGYA